MEKLKNLIHLLPISTTKQLDDIYTKVLSPWYLFQVESHQYLLPNLWEIYKDMGTRLLEES